MVIGEKLNSLSNVVPKLEEIPSVRDYLDVLPKVLFGLPPEREVEFVIDVIPGTVPLPIALYQLTPIELNELKL